MNTRELFLRHVAQTSPEPIALEIEKAEGMYMYDVKGKQYLDLIGGISVCNTGHRHPVVIEAIHGQLDKYMHLLVYGELVQTPQVNYAKALCDLLPATLNSVYFTNSGAEATEGAMKLAKRVTNCTQIIAFRNSYHGSTQGALSIIGDEYWRNAYRPLLPDILHLDYNDFNVLQSISSRTACVIMETIQAEAGVLKPDSAWIKAVAERCREVGALFILDEIQVGFGRTGTMFGFEQYGVVPDVILLGKALGGGLPLGAFIADREMMNSFTLDPVLGHITTFGGHPVSCAAGLAGLGVVKELIPKVEYLSSRFVELLRHEKIKKVRAAGLLIGVEFESFEENQRVIRYCLEQGLLTDWFLFAPQCMRIAPPLVISEEEIERACEVVVRGCGV